MIRLNAKLFTGILFALFAVVQPLCAQWVSTPLTSNTRVDRNNPRSLVVDSSNTLHATWSQTNSLGNNVVYHSQKPCQSPWSTPEIISDTALSAGPSSMAIDTNSQEVAMTWTWPPSPGSQVWYAKGTSGSWSYQQVTTNNGNNNNTPSVAIDGVGNVHLAWTSEDTGSTWKIHYAHNRFGAFTEERIALSNPGPFGGGAAPKITLATNGAPHISYREGNFNTYKIEHLWLVHPDSITWHREFLNTPLGEEFVSDIAIDQGDTIHAALSGNSGFGFPVDAYYMKKPPAGLWTTPVTIDILQNSHVVNIHLDKSGTPHVGLEGISGNFYTGNVYYATEGTTAWTNTAININTGSNYTYGANVALDGQGNVHAFVNMDNGASSATAEVVHFKNGSCLVCAVIPSFVPSDTSICVGETVTFANTSAGAINHAWYVDGVLFDTSASTSRTFSTIGTSTITLIEDNGTCGDTISQTIHVSAIPVSGFNFSAEDSVICAGESITFMNTSTGGTSQRWYDNGIQFSTSLSPTRTFIASGLRTIRLISWNGPCSDTTEQTVRVIPVPFASFSFSINDTSICQGDTVQFTNASQNSSLHEWHENGTQFDTAYHTSRVFTTPGLQTIMLIEREEDCRDTATATVNVNTPPTADFTSLSTLLVTDFTDQSAGSVVSWVWDFGDGDTTSTQNPTHTYTQDGSYYVCLEVMDANGCIGSYCDTVTVMGTSRFAAPEAGISLYPNPTSGKVNLDLPKDFEGGELIVFSLEGKRLAEFSLPHRPSGQVEIDLEGLAAGSYLLKIQTPTKVYRGRVMVW